MRDAVVPSALAYWVSKTMHVFGYAALVGWPAFHWRSQWLWIGLGALAHGAATEALQPYCGRNGTPVDVAWDGLGILLGLLPTIWVNGKNRKERQGDPRA